MIAMVSDRLARWRERQYAQAYSTARNTTRVREAPEVLSSVIERIADAHEAQGPLIPGVAAKRALAADIASMRTSQRNISQMHGDAAQREWDSLPPHERLLLDGDEYRACFSRGLLDRGQDIVQSPDPSITGLLVDLFQARGGRR